MWQACSWADHLLGLGRRFRFCDGTSRTRPIIISGAPSKVAIKVCVLFIISFEFCDAVSRLTFELSGDDGRTPGPGWRKCTAYRQTGPGGLPLALRLSEGLGAGFAATCMRVIARPVVAKVQP